MAGKTYVVALDGEMVERGFWIYVWEATTPAGEELLYVGVTGDSSSRNAQSPFNRMGQHLGPARNSSMLRNWLGKRGIVPEQCTFRLVAHGPVLDEADDWAEHCARRDILAGMERQLIEDLVSAGYDVMNRSQSKMPLEETLYREVRRAFAEHFEKLES
jgi:hypothetical protein